MKVLWEAFMCLQFWFVLFCRGKLVKELLVNCWWNWLLVKRKKKVKNISPKFFWVIDSLIAISVLLSRSGVHNSNLMTGKFFFLTYPRAKLNSCNTFKECYTKETSKKWVSRTRLKGSVGHIWPAGRPYVVHACSRWRIWFEKNICCHHNGFFMLIPDYWYILRWQPWWECLRGFRLHSSRRREKGGPFSCSQVPSKNDF